MNRFSLPVLVSNLAYRLHIIGTVLLLAVLSGCGTVRIAYQSAPSLTYWWLDGYLDLNSEQGERVKSDLQAVHDWHRKEELTLVAQLLAEVRARALEPVTTEQTCRWASQARSRFEAVALRMANTLAAQVPTLTAAQINHLDREFEKRTTEWQRDFVAVKPAERLERSVKRTIDRTESFYGRLQPAQLDMVRAQAAAMDFAPEISLRERRRRQQDVVQGLGQLRNATFTSVQRQAALTDLLRRTFDSPDTSYRQHIARITQQACDNFATLHNSMSLQQRTKLSESLLSYEQDVRVLMGQN
ncbi:MAG: DUF6279 family lipoprotein [Rhodoferax sp.]|nr:DUF6279 family lipoprotein [Rhodoferax sp.]